VFLKEWRFIKEKEDKRRRMECIAAYHPKL
jgi:hypothetical protein